jgi:tRNA dimethylallyltransferase
LHAQLIELDPEAVGTVDVKNRRRVLRALEICLLTGKPVAASQAQRADVMAAVTGVFVFRDRAELYARINQRVEAMFGNGVIEEVRTAEDVSATASQMIGFREIRQLLDGPADAGSISQCIAAIQQATRRYAKRQLTWFRRQTNFSPLNLSLLTHNEAVNWIFLRMCSGRRKVSGVRPKG